MKLKRIRYYTMNSWNRSTSMAYNLKVYKVIPNELQNKVFELMQAEGFYEPINRLVNYFDSQFDYKWQAGFNGRSGGYLVLYRGGQREDGTIYSKPGQHIENDEVPVEVRKAFRQLAEDIVATTIDMAKNAEIKTGEHTQSYKYVSY